MTIQVDAVYLDGALHPKQPVALPEGAEVRIAIDTGRSPAPAASPGPDPIAAVIGLADGPAAGDVAERHDDYLYGRP